MEHAESIAEKSYQRGLGVGFANTPEVRKRLELESQKKWLRASILYSTLNRVHSGLVPITMALSVVTSWRSIGNTPNMVCI
jgi:hypothetical protein